jgi:hypothetical protein
VTSRHHPKQLFWITTNTLLQRSREAELEIFPSLFTIHSIPAHRQETVLVLDHLSQIPLGARRHPPGTHHFRPPGQGKRPTPPPILDPKFPRRHFSRLFRGNKPTLPIFPKLHGLNPSTPLVWYLPSQVSTVCSE